mmetsp:Transcript_649/g.746  ORF Transcript_649/g.746 Transcript_649/m.746 type:complete len:106 (+) Transcript_649:91-408(+)
MHRDSLSQGGDRYETSKITRMNNTVPQSILRAKICKTARHDRLGTLIKHGETTFESEFKGTPPTTRKRKSFKVTFKDKETGKELARVVEVESYKKYNSLEPEVKL